MVARTEEEDNEDEEEGVAAVVDKAEGENEEPLATVSGLRKFPAPPRPEAMYPLA